MMSLVIITVLSRTYVRSSTEPLTQFGTDIILINSLVTLNCEQEFNNRNDLCKVIFPNITQLETDIILINSLVTLNCEQEFNNRTE